MYDERELKYIMKSGKIVCKGLEFTPERSSDIYLSISMMSGLNCGPFALPGTELPGVALKIL